MEYTALIILMSCISLCMYLIGHTAGELKVNQKVIDYCKNNTMNLTGELLNDMYPQIFWIEKKQEQKPINREVINDLLSKIKMN